MHEQTALLPIQPKAISLVGFDTKTNLLSGVILGMAKEIDGIIEAYALKFNNFNVLLTGVTWVLYSPKNKIFADPNLIFKGLYAISEYNNSWLCGCIFGFSLLNTELNRIHLSPVTGLVNIIPTSM